MRAAKARYVALLRGINNAGKGPRIAMAELRAIFEDLGFGDVRTLLNSGNVVFLAPAAKRGHLPARIKTALVSKLDLTVPITVLSSEEVAAAVRDNPFTHIAINPSWLLVVVPLVPSGLDRLQPLLKERWKPEAFALGSRAAYLWCARGVAKSPLWAAVERALERSGTARNIATMTKILAALEG